MSVFLILDTTSIELAVTIGLIYAMLTSQLLPGVASLSVPGMAGEETHKVWLSGVALAVPQS